MGGKGPYAELALDRRAEELQTPAEHVMDSAHAGRLPWEKSFLEVGPENVQVVAIKRTENTQEGTVVRLQERAGAATTAVLKSGAVGLDARVQLRPWELKTVIVERVAGGKARVRESSSFET